MMKSKIDSKNNVKKYDEFLDKYTVELVRPCGNTRVLIFKEWMKDSHGIFFKKFMKGSGEIIDGTSSWFIPYANIRGIKITRDLEPALTPSEENQLGPLAVLKKIGKKRQWFCSICDKPLESPNIYYSPAHKQHFTLQHKCASNENVVDGSGGGP